MKILMLGWEFPPIYSGGLGVVSKKLATELANLGLDICFVVPHFVQKQLREIEHTYPFEIAQFDHIQGKITYEKIPVGFQSAYTTYESYDELQKWLTENEDSGDGVVYGDNLFKEIHRFALEVGRMVREKNNFDIIHAHDWITFEAALMAKKISGKPLILHVHSTEIDRTGNNPNDHIFEIERKSLMACDQIIAVSLFTKNILVEQYKIPKDKIKVVHNALRTKKQTNLSLQRRKEENHRLRVGFIGRITLQKGPDYFFEVAKKVLQTDRNVEFVFAGTGDMLEPIRYQIQQHHLSNHVFCEGFLGPEKKRDFYESLDLIIVPSLAEPFGLTILEAVEYGIPAIITKNAGAAEVVQNSLKSDFWDIDRMAHFVISCIRYPVLGKILAEKAYEETRSLNWEQQAEKTKSIYENLLL